MAQNKRKLNMNDIRLMRKATAKIVTDEPAGLQPEKKQSPAKKIAFCGVMSALALVIMLAASLIGVGTYAGPILAAAVLIPICDEYGTKAGLTAWGAIALLSIILMPDRELALFFVCFGWYPLAVRSIFRMKSTWLRLAVRLGIYFVMVALMYGVLCGVMGIDPELAENTRAFNIMLLLLGALVFLLVDSAYCRVITMWQLKWRKQFKRML